MTLELGADEDDDDALAARIAAIARADAAAAAAGHALQALRLRASPRASAAPPGAVQSLFMLRGLVALRVELPALRAGSRVDQRLVNACAELLLLTQLHVVGAGAATDPGVDLGRLVALRGLAELRLLPEARGVGDAQLEGLALLARSLRRLALRLDPDGVTDTGRWHLGALSGLERLSLAPLGGRVATVELQGLLVALPRLERLQLGFEEASQALELRGIDAAAIAAARAEAAAVQQQQQQQSSPPPRPPPLAVALRVLDPAPCSPGPAADVLASVSCAAVAPNLVRLSLAPLLLERPASQLAALAAAASRLQDFRVTLAAPRHHHHHHYTPHHHRRARGSGGSDQKTHARDDDDDDGDDDGDDLLLALTPLRSLRRLELLTTGAVAAACAPLSVHALATAAAAWPQLEALHLCLAADTPPAALGMFDRFSRVTELQLLAPLDDEALFAVGSSSGSGCCSSRSSSCGDSGDSGSGSEAFGGGGDAAEMRGGDAGGGGGSGGGGGGDQEGETPDTSGLGLLAEAGSDGPGQPLLLATELAAAAAASVTSPTRAAAAAGSAVAAGEEDDGSWIGWLKASFAELMEGGGGGGGAAAAGTTGGVMPLAGPAQSSLQHHHQQQQQQQQQQDAAPPPSPAAAQHRAERLRGRGLSGWAAEAHRRQAQWERHGRHHQRLHDALATAAALQEQHQHHHHHHHAASPPSSGGGGGGEAPTAVGTLQHLHAAVDHVGVLPPTQQQQQRGPHRGGSLDSAGGWLLRLASLGGASNDGGGGGGGGGGSGGGGTVGWGSLLLGGACGVALLDGSSGGAFGRGSLDAPRQQQHQHHHPRSSRQRSGGAAVTGGGGGAGGSPLKRTTLFEAAADAAIAAVAAAAAADGSAAAAGAPPITEAPPGGAARMSRTGGKGDDDADDDDGSRAQPLPTLNVCELPPNLAALCLERVHLVVASGRSAPPPPRLRSLQLQGCAVGDAALAALLRAAAPSLRDFELVIDGGSGGSGGGSSAAGSTITDASLLPGLAAATKLQRLLIEAASPAGAGVTLAVAAAAAARLPRLRHLHFASVDSVAPRPHGAGGGGGDRGDLDTLAASLCAAHALRELTLVAPAHAGGWLAVVSRRLQLCRVSTQREPPRDDGARWCDDVDDDTGAPIADDDDDDDDGDDGSEGSGGSGASWWRRHHERSSSSQQGGTIAAGS